MRSAGLSRRRSAAGQRRLRGRGRALGPARLRSAAPAGPGPPRGGREARWGGAGRGRAEPSRAAPSCDGGWRGGQPAGGAQPGAAGPVQDVPAAVVPAGRRVPAELLQRHGECGRLSRRRQPLPRPAWLRDLLWGVGKGPPAAPGARAAGGGAGRQGTQRSSPCRRSAEQLCPLLLLRQDGLVWLARAKTTSCFFLEAARQSLGLCSSALSQIHPLIFGAPGLGSPRTVQRSVGLAVPYGRNKRLLLWNFVVQVLTSAFTLSFPSGGIRDTESW